MSQLSKPTKESPEEFFAHRCKTCLMPDVLVELRENVCEYCSPTKERKTVTLDSLVKNNNKDLSAVEELKKICKDSPGKYDCMVGMTGGKDSTYLLYYTTEVLKLRPLAVNYDTGFMTEEVVENMINATDQLGVDFIRYRVDGKFLRKLYRGFIKHYGEACSVCHTGHFYLTRKVAKEYGITVNLRGVAAGDLNQEVPDYYNFFCHDQEEFYKKVLAFAKEEGITDEELEFHKDYLVFDWVPENFQTYDVPDLLEYKWQDIDKVLKSLNWKTPKNMFIHADCCYNPVLCCQQRYADGYSEKQFLISNMVIAGDIPVERGKKLLLNEENLGWNDIPEFQRFLDFVGLDEAAFFKATEKHWKERKCPGI